MLVNSVQNIPFKFVCEKCDYHSNKKSQYTRHLQTKKHISKNASRDASEKVPYACSCGKVFYTTLVIIGIRKHAKLVQT